MLFVRPFKFFTIFLLFLMFSLIFMNMQIRYLYIMLFGKSVMSQLLIRNTFGSLE